MALVDVSVRPAILEICRMFARRPIGGDGVDSMWRRRVAVAAGPAGWRWLDYRGMAGRGISINTAGLLPRRIDRDGPCPREASSAALGAAGVGTKDTISGLLIAGFKAGSDASVVNDLRWVATFWVDAAVFSIGVTLRRRKPRRACRRLSPRRSMARGRRLFGAAIGPSHGG